MNAISKWCAVSGMCVAILGFAAGQVAGQEANSGGSATIAQGGQTAQPVSVTTEVQPGPPTVQGALAPSTAMASKGPTRRLPRYFASLVDSRQRQAIYEIQAAMALKIEALEKQLEELRQTELQQMEAVLNDQQRQQLQTLRASRLTPAPTPVGS